MRQYYYYFIIIISNESGSWGLTHLSTVKANIQFSFCSRTASFFCFPCQQHLTLTVSFIFFTTGTWNKVTRSLARSLTQNNLWPMIYHHLHHVSHSLPATSFSIPDLNRPSHSLLFSVYDFHRLLWPHIKNIIILQLIINHRFESCK